jgi:hypothetical protein
VYRWPALHAEVLQELYSLYSPFAFGKLKAHDGLVGPGGSVCIQNPILHGVASAWHGHTTATVEGGTYGCMSALQLVVTPFYRV